MAKKKGSAHRTTEQQLADAEAKLNALREKARREDTRRRILIGSMLLGKAEADDAKMEQLLHDLDTWLASGHRDRRLWLDYGLGPIRGLYGATLHPSKQQGWVFGRELPPAVAPMRDRYGNPCD
ncbi:MAG: hypothetical protein LC677_11345 [Halomonas sp.]|nr:hypothetical protein [Halomonas sp.]